MLKHSLLPALAALLPLALASPPALAQAPAPNPPTSSIREWVILLSDPFLPRANDPAIVPNALPGFISSRRTSPSVAPVNRPSPIGVIRIKSSSAAKIDIGLMVRSGSIFATWPAARIRGANDALWRDIQLLGDSRAMMPIDSDNWLRGLRNASGPYLFTADRSERFILYDVTVPLSPASPLSIAAGGSEDSLKVANASHAVLHDISLYRPDRGGGWFTESLDSLPPAPGVPVPPSTPIAAAPQPQATSVQQQQQLQREQTLRAQITRIELQRQVLAQQGVNAADLATMLAQLDAQQQSLEQQIRPPLPSGPAINPAAAAEKADGPQTTLVRAAAVNRNQLLAEWKQKLVPYDLADADLDMIADILFAQLAQSQWLMAVYRLDDAELARILPLEVTPTSADVRRVGLVVVRNIDPRIPSEIDSLISRLGDNDWSTREQASTALASMGLAARAKLMGALSSKDMEVVVRAERLLAAMSALSKAGPVETPLNDPQIIRILR